jgi:hypothetical protein
MCAPDCLGDLTTQAARRGHAEVAEVLVVAGCDLSVRNQRGNTATMVADAWDNQEVVQLLKRIQNKTRKRVLKREAQVGLWSPHVGCFDPQLKLNSSPRKPRTSSSLL